MDNFLKKKQEEVSNLSNNAIRLEKWTKGRHINQIFNCNKCNHEFDRRYESFLKHPTCPQCEENKFLLKHQEYIKKASDDKISLIKWIPGNHSNHSFKCNSCKHIFEKRYDNFLKNPSCPKCDSYQSKCERIIEKILDNKNINFSQQYRINECRNVLPLPFDFALFDQKDNLKCLIEYDGEDHFKMFARTSTETQEEIEKKFQQRQINDNIKTEYCKTNNIPLIRISYMEQDNIEEIIEQVIFKLDIPEMIN